MIQSSENLVTDGRTDGQANDSDFIGRCPTNLERPKQNKWINKFLKNIVDHSF